MRLLVVSLRDCDKAGGWGGVKVWVAGERERKSCDREEKKNKTKKRGGEKEQECERGL